MKRYICLILIAGITLAGCALFPPKEEKTAKELSEEGMKAFNKKRYRDAIEAFRALKDWYPFDDAAIVAELKIADSHYHLKEYDDAILAYEEFENLHPRNTSVPYVIYQIGICYFDQMDTVDRDQTPTRKALETFTRLIKQFPDTPYSNKAQKHVSKCYQNLAGHEMYVARFQYKTKRYKGALARFKAVIEDYPQVDGIEKEAGHYIALCQEALQRAEIEKNRKKALHAN